MTFAEHALHHSRPESIRQDVDLPRRQSYYPSPGDWRDEILYFLLVDRFSDGQEAGRPLLNRKNLVSARQAINGQPWRWDRWADSGAGRWQGGTLQGVTSKLGYLKALGVTTIWLSPVFKQRAHLNTYHGYGIQDFLDVDTRFGTRKDLVDLVSAAHDQGLRIILDIIFNHSGSNWIYPGGASQPPYQPPPARYGFGAWLDGQGRPSDTITAAEDGVWPVELQDVERYTRAGSGNLGAGSIDDPQAEHKRTDFLDLRDFRLDAPGLLNDLARCYKYWIALTDCDGFRIDTLKHVSADEARNFCGTVKEFTANLGKHDFFLVGEIAGGDFAPGAAALPVDMHGNYFFADFIHGWIHQLNPDQPGKVTEFASGLRRPVDLRFDSAGSLYVLLRNAWVIDDKFVTDSGSVVRIRPVHR